MQLVWYTTLVIGFLLIFSGNAHAYIDPSSGSYFLQFLIAGLLGAAFAVKTYWRKITSYFKNKFTSGNKQ